MATVFFNNLTKRLRDSLSNPTIIIVFSFLIVILIGSVLLSLPISSEDGQFTRYLDSLFTATSATCVTGLIVVETGDHWNLFSELVIISLIQIGGLGFITLATYFLSTIGRKTGLKSGRRG